MCVNVRVFVCARGVRVCLRAHSHHRRVLYNVWVIRLGRDMGQLLLRAIARGGGGACLHQTHDILHAEPQ